MSESAFDTPKYDALMVDSAPAGATQSDKLQALRELAVPYLGAAVHYVRPGSGGGRYSQGGRYFITTDPADSINHPYGHPRGGFPRYDWTEVAPGVKAGRLNG